MSWSQDDERMLAIIERHLSVEDPRLAARLESFNERVERHDADHSAPRGRRRRVRRSTIVIAISWLLIATLIVTLLIMAFHHDAAALAR